MTRWLKNRNEPIDFEETEFLKQNDLISVSPVEKPPFRKFFETSILLPASNLFKFPRRQEEDTTLLAHQTTVFLHNEPDTLVSLGVFTTAGILLISPLWILSKTTGAEQKLSVITAYLLAFLTALTWGTTSSPFEIFAATAG